MVFRNKVFVLSTLAWVVLPKRPSILTENPSRQSVGKTRLGGCVFVELSRFSNVSSGFLKTVWEQPRKGSNPLPSVLEKPVISTVTGFFLFFFAKLKMEAFNYLAAACRPNGRRGLSPSLHIINAMYCNGLGKWAAVHAGRLVWRQLIW